MSASSGEQAASKLTVGVKVGKGVGVAVGVCVAVAVGRGVGVSGMINRVAARQARLERSRAITPRSVILDVVPSIISESSTGWEIQEFQFKTRPHAK